MALKLRKLMCNVSPFRGVRRDMGQLLKAFVYNPSATLDSERIEPNPLICHPYRYADLEEDMSDVIYTGCSPVIVFEKQPATKIAMPSVRNAGP